MFNKLKQKKELDKKAKEQQENVIKLREFIRKEFWPFLKETSKDVSDAQMFCQAVSTAIKEEFQKEMRQKMMKELDIIAQLDKKSTEYDRFLKVFQIFDTQSLSNTLMAIEGMGQAINAYVMKEQKSRKLEDLKDFAKDFE